MSETTGDIKIINGPQQTIGAASAAASEDHLPREGETARAEAHFGFAFFTNKPVEHLTDQIEALRGKIVTVVKSLAQAVADNVELDEIAVGLAVTINGDIGIASAGAQASIQLTYKVKH